MTTMEQLKARGFVFFCPVNIEEFKQLLLKSGLEFEFAEVTEKVCQTTLVFLGVKRLTPTLKKQLGAAEIKRHTGFPKGD